MAVRSRLSSTAVSGPARVLRGGDDTIRSARSIPTIFNMTLLGAGAAFFVGNAYQAQMPELARDFGHGDPGVTYSMLLAADAAGALAAGIGLETMGLLAPRARTALLLATAWAVSLVGFALTRNYIVALLLLFAAGFLELSFNSMAQALVQLAAPAESRGRMIGLFSMASAGMRTFSGVTVGLAGQAIGVHWSLAVSGALVIVLCSTLQFARVEDAISLNALLRAGFLLTIQLTD